VGEGKADVERRIAEMDDFVVEEDQFALVHENIFGAEVAVTRQRRREKVVWMIRWIASAAWGSCCAL